MPHATPSEGTESGLHAEAQICRCSKNNDPYIWSSMELWAHFLLTKKGKTHFKWLAKCCQDIPYDTVASLYFPAELVLWWQVAGWQGDKVAVVHGWGSINKSTKLIITKWSQNPLDYTHWATHQEVCAPSLSERKSSCMASGRPSSAVESCDSASENSF